MLEATLLPFYPLLLKAINFNSNKETQGIAWDLVWMNLPPTLDKCCCIIRYIQFYLPLSIFSSSSLITLHFSVAIADSLLDSNCESHMNKNNCTFTTSKLS